MKSNNTSQLTHLRLLRHNHLVVVVVSSYHSLSFPIMQIHEVIKKDNTFHISNNTEYTFYTRYAVPEPPLVGIIFCSLLNIQKTAAAISATPTITPMTMPAMTPADKPLLELPLDVST